jgi:hypothetical protein
VTIPGIDSSVGRVSPFSGGDSVAQFAQALPRLNPQDLAKLFVNLPPDKTDFQDAVIAEILKRSPNDQMQMKQDLAGPSGSTYLGKSAALTDAERANLAKLLDSVPDLIPFLTPAPSWVGKDPLLDPALTPSPSGSPQLADNEKQRLADAGATREFPNFPRGQDLFKKAYLKTATPKEMAELTSLRAETQSLTDMAKTNPAGYHALKMALAAGGQTLPPHAKPADVTKALQDFRAAQPAPLKEKTGPLDKDTQAALDGKKSFLRLGDKGPGVDAVRRALTQLHTLNPEKYPDPGNPKSGAYDAQLNAAVEKVQQLGNPGKKADHVVGPETRGWIAKDVHDEMAAKTSAKPPLKTAPPPPPPPAKTTASAPAEKPAAPPPPPSPAANAPAPAAAPADFKQLQSMARSIQPYSYGGLVGADKAVEVEQKSAALIDAMKNGRISVTETGMTLATLESIHDRALGGLSDAKTLQLKDQMKSGNMDLKARVDALKGGWLTAGDAAQLKKDLEAKVAGSDEHLSFDPSSGIRYVGVPKDGPDGLDALVSNAGTRYTENMLKTVSGDLNRTFRSPDLGDARKTLEALRTAVPGAANSEEFKKLDKQCTQLELQGRVYQINNVSYADATKLQTEINAAESKFGTLNFGVGVDDGTIENSVISAGMRDLTATPPKLTPAQAKDFWAKYEVAIRASTSLRYTQQGELTIDQLNALKQSTTKGS